jgi:hypothetical protein
MDAPRPRRPILNLIVEERILMGDAVSLSKATGRHLHPTRIATEVPVGGAVRDMALGESVALYDNGEIEGLVTYGMIRIAFTQPTPA